MARLKNLRSSCNDPFAAGFANYIKKQVFYLSTNQLTFSCAGRVSEVRARALSAPVSAASKVARALPVPTRERSPLSKLPALVQLLKLGNGQLAGVVVDDRVAAAVRELAIEMMAASNPRSVHEACVRVGQAVAWRLDTLEEAPLKTLPWSRPPTGSRPGA